VVVLVLTALVVLGGWAWLNADGDADDIKADVVVFPVLGTDLTGYERAIEPYEWQFPADHGAHPTFQTEWWYYTGNLATDTGRRFGFQFTIFRRAMMPTAPDSDSEWRTNQVYMAHFTVTDVAEEAFYYEQRFSRGAAGLAGATVEPRLRVWLEDWEIRALDEDATQTHITAITPAMAVDLTLDQVKPPVLQGFDGLSPKGSTPGNASYYYSLPRLLTQGTVTVQGQTYTVSGTTWMDHEFSTGALSAETQGWDWFALHLDDNRDLMVGYIRLTDGSIGMAYGGSLVQPDGSARILLDDDFTIETLDTWTSPYTGATYPAKWQIIVNPSTADGDTPLRLTLTPLVADQELVQGGIIYWEGALRATGDVTGYGYAELTGYTEAMQTRF
jgi:predicted secreted hydrolase